jgi:ribosomal protein L9
VLLLEDYQKLGKKGEIIEVKRGHARNLLVPRKIAGKISVAVLQSAMFN